MMSDNPIDFLINSVKMTGNLDCLHKPGAVRLTGYPELVFAPKRYGHDVCTEDHGIPVADIVAEFAMNPSYEAVATKFGTTPLHVAAALRYAIAAGVAQEES